MPDQSPLEFLLKDRKKLLCRNVRIEDFKQLESFFLGVPAMDLQTFKDKATVDKEIKNWLLKIYQKKIAQLAVLDNKEIVAFGSLQPGDDYRKNTAEIKILVTPGMRRQGIGTRLFDLLLGRALEAGIQRIIMRYNSENKGIKILLANYGIDSEITLNYQLEDEVNKLHRDLVVTSLNISDWKRRFEFQRPPG